MNYSKKLSLPNGFVKYPTVLSPMAGVTDPPFRRLIRELSQDRMGILVSEFISTDGCDPFSLKNRKQASFSQEERPFGIQIFGRDPERMANAAAMIETLSPDFIEINAGCPVPKVAGKGGGAGLLKDLPRLRKIIAEVRKVIQLPLTLKCRLGWDEESINVMETLAIAEGEGIHWLTVHGRTRVQGYNGFADWEKIGEVASQAKIPVIGNGDVVSALGAIEVMNRYPVAGVAIGRGALHNPWLFGQIASLCDGKEVSPISAREVVQTFFRYYDLMIETGAFPEGALGRLKQLAARLCKGFSPSLPNFRQDLLVSQSVEAFMERAKMFMESECDGYYFEPERLLNLNGKSSEEIIFERQFKR
ncbi:MAG: tRNA-dihydrouridine synthase [Fibrobacteraceae bacterium]|nr:tRNA-dihydrouridine synthase [Fibrobacteraceae bacterium]